MLRGVPAMTCQMRGTRHGEGAGSAARVSGPRGLQLPRYKSATGAGSCTLHVRVVRPAAAFGRDPDDVLQRILDVAGLALHAVLRVDLQARLGLDIRKPIDTRGA